VSVNGRVELIGLNEPVENTYIMAGPEWIEFFEILSPHTDDKPRSTVFHPGTPLVLLIRKYLVARI
jgi:hypothetical protein